MHLEVKAGLADGPVPARTLSLLDYLDGRMNPDPKDIQRRKQCVQSLGHSTIRSFPAWANETIEKWNPSKNLARKVPIPRSAGWPTRRS